MTAPEMGPTLEVLASKKPLLIAHRGFSRLAPENTLPAFERALAAGVDLVELDARATRDGCLIVIHDHELDRTTDATANRAPRHQRVEAKSVAEIRALDAGIWFGKPFAGTKIPLLSEAVAAIRQGSIPLIERKAGNVDAYVTFLREQELINRVIVQSFDWHFLRTLHQIEPHLVLGALGPAHRLSNGKKPLGISRKLNGRWLKQLERTGARVVVWNRQISKRAVQLAHARGLRVWIYTIDDPRLARRLLAAGVDGLITNDPTRIRATFPPEPLSV